MNKESIIKMPADAGGKRADLEAVSGAFFDEVLGPVLNIIQAANNAVSEARVNMEEAVRSYTADLDARKAGLRLKVQRLQETIEDCQQKVEKATADLGTALSSDDEAAEEEAKQVVEEASIAEYTAKRRMEALSRAKITGNSDLYYRAIAAHSDVYAKICSAAITGRDMKQVIDELISALSQAREKAESFDNLIYTERIVMRRIWPMIESFGGPVDFTHATAGDDDSCKVRFLEALATRQPDEGFANSPAGPRLAQDIDLMIEHEENQDS